MIADETGDFDWAAPDVIPGQTPAILDFATPKNGHRRGLLGA